MKANSVVRLSVCKHVNWFLWLGLKCCTQQTRWEEHRMSERDEYKQAIAINMHLLVK